MEDGIDRQREQLERGVQGNNGTEDRQKDKVVRRGRRNRDGNRVSFDEGLKKLCPVCRVFFSSDRYCSLWCKLIATEANVQMDLFDSKYDEVVK